MFRLRCWIIILGGILLFFSPKLLAQENDPDFDLLMAADTGSVSYTRVALIEGAEVNFRSEDGITALMYASANGHLDVVELLLENDANPNLEPYYTYKTALYSAVESGYVEIAELLILKGADMTVKSDFGVNLLHVAAENHIWEMVDLLLYYGMEYDALDEDKKTPLMHAAFFGMEGNMTLLLDGGANIHLVDEDGNTALHLAAINGFLEATKVLVNAGANLEVKNVKGFTALDLAAMKGNEDVVKYLIQQNAQIHDSIQREYNTLTLARKSGNGKVVKLLKENGAQPSLAPYFNSMGFGLLISSNTQDAFVGVGLSIHEDKSNIDFDLRYLSRGSDYQVLIKKDPGYYEYYWEDRYLFGAGIVKSFDIIRPKSGFRFGLQFGAHQYVSKAKLTGREIQPLADFFPGFLGGLSMKYEMFKFGLSYEYMNVPTMEYLPHRFNFDFRVYLNFKNDLYYNVLI